MKDPTETIRVVFLDRDGPIVVDREALHRLSQVDLAPGAVDGLRILEGMGFALVLVSNQSGVARGRFTEDDVRAVHDYVRTILAEQGVHLRGMFYCPHHPEGSVPEYAIICECRKPAVGLARQAASLLGEINYAQSWVIGDKPSDVAFGVALGARTVLLRSRYWTVPPVPPPRPA
jgi:D-glycero-D-manno-heptose 1,7-bisphosphate phosphatase